MADTKQLKVGNMVRAMSVDKIEVRKDADGKSRFNMTLSSEYAVDRGWGYKEVLSHDPKAVRMDRAKNGTMPLLFNHNWSDPVGMVDGASIKNKKLNIEGVFFSTARAQDIATMVTEGLRNVSVGYRINKIEEDREAETYTIIDWEPYEASVAPVPADPTVGMDRAEDKGAERMIEVTVRIKRDDDPDETDEEIPGSAETPGTTGSPGPKLTDQPGAEAKSLKVVKPKAGDRTMGDNSNGSAGGAGAGGAGDAGGAAGGAAGAGVSQVRGASANEMEQGRIAAINNMCKACDVKDEGMIRQWITAGTSVKDVSDDIMRIVEQRAKVNKNNNSAAIGLSNNEAKRFSIVRAILAASDGDWKNAGFEAECSREISKRMNAVPDSKKFYIPYEVQERGIDPSAINAQQRAFNLALSGATPHQQRADIVATTTLGGFLVQTTNVGFIELLRNRAVAYRMGATQLPGLVGNVNVPKQTAAATAAWLASETTQITEVEQTFGQMALTPHTVGAYTEISRLLLLQSSPGVEGIVNADLAAVAALAVDVGALVGTGATGQPTGIKNAAGVGVASAGDMATIAYKGQLDFQVAVANANVVPSRGGYVTTPTVAALLMQRTRFPNTMSPLWDGNLWDANGQLGCAGFPGMSSNQMPASAMYFGDWSSLVVAEWGVLEVEVNPYANFQAGIIGIRAMMTIDIGLRYPAAFCIQGANIT